VLVDLVETVGGSHDCIVLCSVLVSSFLALPSCMLDGVFVGREGKQDG
jgi:hypothetical protein